MVDRDEVVDRLDPTLLDTIWNFDDPAGSEAIFRKHIAQLEPGSIAAAELAMQIARAMGLQGRFDEADAVLDSIASEHPVVGGRVKLERGESGTPVAIRPRHSPSPNRRSIQGTFPPP